MSCQCFIIRNILDWIFLVRDRIQQIAYAKMSSFFLTQILATKLKYYIEHVAIYLCFLATVGDESMLKRDYNFKSIGTFLRILMKRK